MILVIKRFTRTSNKLQFYYLQDVLLLVGNAFGRRVVVPGPAEGRLAVRTQHRGPPAVHVRCAPRPRKVHHLRRTVRWVFMLLFKQLLVLTKNIARFNDM